MHFPHRIVIPAFLLAVLMATACDRHLEPFDPDEKPSDPDLSAIFPDPEPTQEPSVRQPQRAPASQRGNVSPPAQGPPVRGTIEVAKSLAESIPEGAVLFIIARSAAAAGGPPLAVVKIPAPEFPLDFEIGPEHVMIPRLTFSGQLRITARLDSDGNAMTRLPGDLHGAVAEAVAPGARGVVLVLDQQV